MRRLQSFSTQFGEFDMSNVKHTPGPWFITGNLTKYVEARIGNKLVQEVAAVGPTDADGGYGVQQLANARLIAAAPELFSLLVEAHSELGEPEMWEFRNRIAAAIAKATGEIHE